MCSSTQRRTLLEQATIHDRENAGTYRALGSGLIDHPLLQPQRRQLEANALIHDRGHVLRPAEDIDDVHALVRPEHLRQLIEACDRRLAEDLLGIGIHWDDAIAEAL